MSDAMSYTQLSASLPSVSDKGLTERLTDLVSKGLLERRVSNGFPRRTEYELTHAGEALRPASDRALSHGIAVQGHRAN